MQLPLLTGFYQSRSVIASAQRCFNLYPEVNVNETYMGLPAMTAAAQVTMYPTPGTLLLGSLSAALQGPGRGLYAASNGTLYAVVANTVYMITPQWQYIILGYIQLGSTPVSMADNAVTLVLVDGTPTGYTIDLATNTFGTIVDPTGSFAGADTVQYLDGFFIFNKPGFPQFYCSLNETITFDPLYFANKNGASDNLVTLIVNQRNIWLLGADTTEIWYDSGDAQFPFQINPSNFIQHGCAAKYSVAKQDASIFWLARDPQGALQVLVGTDYTTNPVSTFAIQNEFSSYARVDDAIGFTYQQLGHIFYVLTFPTADKTWVFDVTVELWHERGVVDAMGTEHRIRANGYAFAYGQNVVIDFANGSLLAMRPDVYTDLGQPIVRERTFPHLVNELKRIIYRKFVADMETGNPEANLAYKNVSSPVLSSSTPFVGFTNPPSISLAGATEAFAGTVFPSGAAIQIAVGTSGTIQPTVGWVSAAVLGGTWTGSLTMPAEGSYFVWARQTAQPIYAAVTPFTVAYPYLANQQTADGAVHQYLFAETSGSALIDTGSSPQNGTYIAPYLLGQASIVPGEARAVVIQSGGFAQLPFQDPPAGVGGAWSIEIVFNPSAIAPTGRIFNNARTDVNNHGFTILGNSSSFFGFDVAFSGGLASTQMANPLVQNQSVHIVGVFDGTAIHVYQNGVLSASATSSGTYVPGGNNIEFGINAGNPSFDAAPGTYQCAAMYNKALSATQAAYHYQCFLHGALP